MRIALSLTVFVLTLAVPSFAGTLKETPATLMLQPGKLLHSEDFTQPLAKGWIEGKGKWLITDCVLRGAELAADMHGAVKRLPVKFDSAVIQYSFKIDGAKVTSLSINAAKRHISRVKITPTSLSVQKDADKKKNEKAVVLDAVTTSISPSEWHTIVVELNGKDIIAKLDGKHVALGSHDGIAMPKANIGFTVAGESMSFKNLRVYEGTPLPTWNTTKAKILAERGK